MTLRGLYKKTEQYFSLENTRCETSNKGQTRMLADGFLKNFRNLAVIYPKTVTSE